MNLTVPAARIGNHIARPVDLPAPITQDAIDYATAEWMPKINGDDLADQLARLDDLLCDLVRAHRPDAVGAVVCAVMRGYAARLAMRDLDLDAAAGMPDARALAAAVLVQGAA